MKKYLAVLKKLFWFRNPNNLKVVVYCVLTASTFWFFSALNKNYDTTVNFPVTWDYDQNKYIAVQELPEEIQMNVSGLGWTLLRANSGIRLNPIMLHLNDPTNQKRLPGSYFANQVAEGLEELELNYIIDDSLHFDVDFRIQKSFPFYIDSAHISLSEEYRITSTISCDTNFVVIDGPKQMLQQMAKDTFWVYVIETNIDEDFEAEIPFQLEYPDLMLANPQSVNVSFQVRKFQEEEFQVPITRINTRKNQTIELNDTIVSVHYFVQDGLQDSVNTSLFVVEANMRKINPTDSTVLLKLINVPDLVVDPSIDFPQVKVKYND